MSLKKNDIFNILNKLELDKKDFIVISGANLVVREIIEETPDIDLTCSKKVYDNLLWKEKIGAAGVNIKYIDNIEIGNNFYDEDDFEIINGYKFSSLKSVLRIKKELNREKDKEIIKKLEEILERD